MSTTIINEGAWQIMNKENHTGIPPEWWNKNWTDPGYVGVQFAITDQAILKLK